MLRISLFRKTGETCGSGVASGLESCYKGRFCLPQSLSSSRFFSQLYSSSWEKFYTDVHEKPTNSGKIVFLFEKYLQTTLSCLNLRSSGLVEEDWESFRQFTISAQQKNLYPKKEVFPLINNTDQNTLEEACHLLAATHLCPMFSDGSIQTSYTRKNLNRTLSDLYWSEEVPIGLPFTQKREKVCQNLEELDTFL